jgi:hypothetical protein
MLATTSDFYFSNIAEQHKVLGKISVETETMLYGLLGLLKQLWVLTVVDLLLAAGDSEIVCVLKGPVDCVFELHVERV